MISKKDVQLLKATFLTKKEANSRFRAIEGRLGNVESRLDKVESRLDKVESRLDNIENRLDAVENRLEKIENKVNQLLTLVSDVMGELKAMREELPIIVYRQAEHSDQLAMHEERIVTLEKNNKRQIIH
ncbi:MAG: hypothetical protein PVJ09_01215 [Candidatus Woesebacteria bacterium]|jgi:archaellum component FlaC